MQSTFDYDGKLKETLDTSSSQTRNLFITFLLFLFYIAVITASTTHKDLLFPNSTVRLPILNIELPLFAFFGTTPLLILAFHWNLLFNLQKHSIRLSRWEETGHDKEDTLKFPFLFNYPNNFLVKIFTWLLVYIFPLSLLSYIQLVFLPYHHPKMTFWHQSSVFIDAISLTFYWFSIRHPSWKYEYLFGVNNVEIKRFLKYHLVHISTIFCFFSFSFFIAVIPITNDEKIPLTDRMISPFITRNLNLREAVLVASPPGDAIIAAYIMKGKGEKKAKEKAWLEHAEGLNLQGRDLRDAIFAKAKLYNVDLRKAQLWRADLQQAKLQEANLKYAQLQGANLQEAKLQKANLKHANLQGADLRDSDLQGADLEDANLQGANLYNARLQETDLIGAKLQGAYLWSANLQGADLKGAHLQGANLVNANLQGASLSFADLQGANLRNADLQGADLRYSGLQGADLRNADLQGTDLSLSCIPDADFTSTNLDGVLAVDIDTDEETDWPKLIEEILPLIPDKRKVGFQERIASAQARANDPNHALPEFKNDKDEILKVRKRLVCKSKGIARNYLYQGFDETILEIKIRAEVTEHVKNNCPEFLPEGSR